MGSLGGMNLGAGALGAMAGGAAALADLQVNVGATTPVFLNEEERKRSITLQGKAVNVVSRSVTSDTSTNLTVTGLSTGASFNVALTVKADPSRL